ncbi:MAG: DUF6599 family protein, partial [Candidatus Latescibacterota bacterium]
GGVPAMETAFAGPERAAWGTWHLLEDRLPQGWRMVGREQHFTAANLYEKIDGRAEQYAAYDVAGLSCVTLGRADGELVDVFVYDMGAPLNAFGIFACERPPQAPPTPLGSGGYLVQSSSFFWKGRHYVQVLAEGAGPEGAQVAVRVAQALATSLPGGGEEIWGLRALPAEGLRPASVQYFRRDALGLDFLAETFTATYTVSGAEVTAFVARHPSPAEADSTRARYRRYLDQYGTLLAPEGALDIGVVYGAFEVVFQQGIYVGGASGSGEREAALTLAAAVRRHLREG